LNIDGRLTLKRRARALLRLRNLHVTRWSNAVNARRVTILRSLAVEQLIDVGANVGQYAHDLRDAGYSGKIISCEPVEQPFTVLERAAASDPLWVCRRVGLGSSPGEAEISVAGLSVFSSFLSPTQELLEIDPSSAGLRVERVQVVTLDDLVDETCDPGRPLGVKIDAQGAERQILSGAANTLDRAAYIELELSPRPLYDGEASMLEMIAFMEHLGYWLGLVENVASDGRTGRALQVNGIFTRA
jgi:FkbM family methyltransferase